MKNKKKFIILTIIAVVLLLLIPIPLKLKDGGSTEYRAILYKVTKLHENTTSGYVNGLKISILGYQVYSKTNKVVESLNNNKELLQCLENELGGYLVTENDNLVEISLSEIININKEKIAYYKGVYASNHPDNMYIIVYPQNGLYDLSVMKDFEKYFYEKYSIYQRMEISAVTIYIHNQNNDVDFNDIGNKCGNNINTTEGKSISSETVDKLNNTKKIVIKSNQNDLKTINDKEKIEKVLSAISSSKQYGDAFLCDGNNFEFKMYDNNNKLIDTIYVWGDGKRLIPASIHSDCFYYSITNGIDLREFIEQETNYVFYNILNFKDNDDQKLQVIYSDDKYNYYLNTEDPREILIQFLIDNKTMTLKYALDNNYILVDKVYNDYPDLLIRKNK